MMTKTVLLVSLAAFATVSAQSCRPGYYGENCNQGCSPGCPNDSCDAATGECTPDIRKI